MQLITRQLLSRTGRAPSLKESQLATGVGLCLSLEGWGWGAWKKGGARGGGRLYLSQSQI